MQGASHNQKIRGSGVVLTIKNKLIVNAGIVVLALAALSWLAISGLARMGDLQDSGYHTTIDSGTANGNANIGARLYQIVADAEINRELAQSDKSWAEAKAQSLEQIAEIEKIADTAEEKQLAAKAKAALTTYIDLYEKQMRPLLATAPVGQITDAIREIDGKVDEQSSIVKESLEKIAASMKAEAAKSDEEFDGTRRSTINWFMGIAGGVIVVLALMSAWIIRSITRPLNEAVTVADELAAGNLNVRIESISQDEIGHLQKAMHNMVVKLTEIIGVVRSSADALSSESEQISATAQSLSQASSEQAASVEETSASIEQMTASINQNTENAKVTDSMAAKAAKEATEGGQAVSSTVEAMKKIAGKIGIVDDIAYQTNLLALNAAIEAARAGEHGKGFAVVAAEVRKLAERSQIAAQEISELADSSVGLAEKAGKLLDAMVPSINKTSDLVQEIASASAEQSSGVAQINSAMGQLNQTTQQNASASEEMAATAEVMSNQTEQLRNVMLFFKLDDEAVRMAV